jgi:hypothetical protein
VETRGQISTGAFQVKKEVKVSLGEERRDKCFALAFILSTSMCEESSIHLSFLFFSFFLSGRVYGDRKE